MGMESKPSQTIRQMLLFLWLTSLFVHIHCMNVSLDSIPLAVLRQRTRKLGSCFQNINLHIGERKAESCGKNIFYPEVKTVSRNHTICFTDAKQNHFDKGNITKNTSVRGCQILHQEEITNACNWLERGYQKLDKDQILLSVVLRCNSTTKQQQQLCLIMAASRSLSDADGDIGMDSCLYAIVKPTRRTSSEKTNSEGSSFLDYIKEYMTPVLAALGSVLFIIMVFVANRIRKQYISSTDESSESEAEVSNTNEGGLYHEPNHHTYIDIDSEERRPRNYEYAYGHLDPASPRSNAAGRLEPGEKHNYMNITQLPDKRKDDEADYINMNKEDDMDYMEMKNRYQTLDRSSIVDDNAMYQGLVQQKDRVRPKVAPKPSYLRRVEEPQLSYVKVL